MKYLPILLITAMFIYNCGSDTVTNTNNNPGCTKSVSLISPANDTVTQIDSVIFTWHKATCDTLINYKLQHSFDQSFPVGLTNGDYITDTTFTLHILHSAGNYQYWRVIAYYTSDSIVTQVYKFKNN